MYLKRLELQGFKSFADKTVLEFMPGITTVIGPNGSGKSNISDAIRWVLGEQSMKSLRGSKSEDIIFAGTQNRKSLGFAEASIVIDNADGKLPIEYAEVTVTRRIYRSGESGYFINKTPCRLKDVLELFMDTGIGKDGYSIIGQGKIDEILSNKSEERRSIFEEAAGIVKYRVRKLESEKKLEQTKLNLLRINDILAEIEDKIGPLKVQSEKAKKFLSLKEELKNVEIGLFLYNINTYKERLEDFLKTNEIMKSQYELEENKLTEFQTLKENLRKEIDTITNTIEEIQNGNLESSKKQEQMNTEVNIAKERIANNEENIQKTKKEIEEGKQRIQELEDEKAQKVDKKTNLYENKERFEKELREKEKELEEITSKLSSKEKEIEDKKRKVEQDTDMRYEKTGNINAQDIHYENLEKREKTVKEENITTISELDKARLEREEIFKTFYEIENKRNKNKQNLNVIYNQKQESERKIKEYDDQINKLVYENRVSDARLKFLKEIEKEKEGYSKSVKAILEACEKDSNLKKGVHDILANILTVPKEYEIAIEMTLGATLQNIVTDTEEDAKKLVEYLRKYNLGRASFLPITAIRGKKVEKLVKNGLQGVIGIVSDLIQYEKKYEQIVLNLLGRTVLVDNMETGIILARQNNYTFRIVTLKGDVINSSGAITGGSVATKSVNILGRKQEIEELEEKVAKLNKQIKENENEKQEYIHSVEAVIHEIEELEKVLQEIEIVYATEKQKVTLIEENIKKLEEKLRKLKEEQNSIALEKQKNREEKQKLEEEIRRLDNEMKELNDEICAYAELNKDNQKYMDDLNFDITNLKISVSSFNESESSIDEMVERINGDIEKEKKNIESKQKQIELTQSDNESLNERIKDLQEKIQTLIQEAENSDQKVINLKEERIVKNQKLEKTEKDILEQLDRIDDSKNQINKMEVKKSKTEVELEQIVNRMWEDYEITPNMAIEQNYQKPSNIQETIKKVNTLRNEIKDLGSINVDSIEEYKLTKERYDFMCEQRLDLEETSNKLKKVITDMTNIMKEQFSEQFKIINKNFSETFTELFGGGKAELKLLDEDDILNCGIDIIVQPPGKKLQNMMLLSGGEKAFTAIALLFAILKINPAPFCVLDEIEAALDDVNVYRFAEYLKKYTKHTQFLVITHRKGTMEVADTVYGITMEENGVSKLLSMKLK